MAIESPDETLRRAQAFLNSSLIRNLHAQAHARAILRNVGRNPESWPHFRPDLDDRLHHAAHALLWSALQLLEAGRARTDVSPLLLAGSEALEFLCADTRYGSAVRLEQAVTATFGYYLGGYYARSYVLLREAVPEETDLPPALALLVAVLRKQLDVARSITITNFSTPALRDEVIARELEAGTLGEDEAYDRILLASATQAVSSFLEYPKTGERQLLDNAITILDDAVLIARERRHVDWWWWLFCLRFLFQELGEASPWERLRPLRGGDGWHLVNEYIRAGLRCQPPMIEFWPSQIHALPTIIAPNRPNFCLKMPTSSGKTRIAELAILRFLLDNVGDGTAKCIYLAPFRSLAVEVEQTLRRSFGTLGVMVSQIYGGFEITPADRVFLNQYIILIATPEKFDALLRFVPELISKIRLVIIDEGHIVDPGPRGLRFEFFIHRLLRRLRGQNCRFVFISAVLPNAEQFSEWITGSPENLVESTWRPSRLMLGRLSWDGGRVRIDYTHEGRERFGQECFVSQFIQQRECKGEPGQGRRRNPFPADATEAFSLSALLFAREGMTLLFIPQQRNAEPAARKLLEALYIHRAFAKQQGEDFSLPTNGRGSPTWKRCQGIIETEMGGDSLLLTLLEEGILVHHGDLPHRVRVAIEDLARGEVVKLIVATTTLAQGVNLPIKTVLVRGLHIDHNHMVSPMTFWNICGRAGRGMKENEGQILFCIDRTKTWGQVRNSEQAIRNVLDTLEQTSVVSGMLLVLQKLALEWQKTHPAIDLSELCLYLAENKFDWAEQAKRSELRAIIDILDGHLVAVSEEFSIDSTNPDRLQEILHGSLLFIQLREQANRGLTPELAKDIFHARIRFIHKSHPDPRVRQRLYLLGMTLTACEQIEANKEHLLDLFCQARDWSVWSHEERAGLLLRISWMIFSVPDTTPKMAVPKQWPAIFSSWLAGTNVTDMVRETEISSYTESASALSLLIEETCGYRLPWGLNSILMHLKTIEEELGKSIPPVCSYFAGMAKYRVCDPVAICLLPYLDQERQLALEAALYCPYDLQQPDDVVRWIVDVSFESLIRAGMEPQSAAAIMAKRNWHKHSSTKTPLRQSNITLEVDHQTYATVTLRDKLLIVPINEHNSEAFHVFTLNGNLLGQYQWSEAIPPWWRETHLVDSEVIHKTKNDSTSYSITVNIVGH